MKISRLILIFASFLFLFLACNKNSSEAPVMEKIITLANPSNSNNPFDDCGILHNKILRMSLDKIGTNPAKANLEDCMLAARESVQQIFLGTNYEEGYMRVSENGDIDDEELTALLQAMLDDIDNNFENFIASLELDAYTKEQLQNLANELLAMEEDESITPNDVFDKVVAFEGRVLNNNILIRIDDREPTLAYTSTLRHSLSFWADEMDLDINMDAPIVIQRMSFWKWVVAGLADAGGAIGGTILGGPGLGAFVGGVGSIGAIIKLY